MSQAPLLEARHLSLAFPGVNGEPVEVLHDINLAISDHEVIAILGPSGCGESTLVRTLIGLQAPTSGDVLHKGIIQTGLNRSAALVFQNFALFPWLTVRQNVALGIPHGSGDAAVVEERVRQAITSVGLHGSDEAFPRELSGGMKQRVGLARALAVQPEIPCMDEPFSALDALTSETLRNEVIDLYTSKASPVKTIVLVTHSIAEAVFMATRLVVMGAHPGTVRAVLDNTLPFPRDEHHPEFVSLSVRLHEYFTQSVMPVEPAPPAIIGQTKIPVQLIPSVTVTATIGLLEVLENEGDQEMFELTQNVEMDLSQLLHVVKAAEMLGWVTTPLQRVEMTPAGRAFLAADIKARQDMLQTTLRGVFVFDLVLKMLERAPRHELEEADLASQLALLFPHERPARIVRMLVSWGRLATLYKYNAMRKTFSRG